MEFPQTRAGKRQPIMLRDAPQMMWAPERLIELRKALRISPERMAEVISEYLANKKISGRKVRRWEDGTHQPSASELAALCRAFHVKLDTFFKPED